MDRTESQKRADDPQGTPRFKRGARVDGRGRRNFLRAMIGSAVGIGIGALDLFPLAQEAKAHDGHNIWTYTTSGPCGAGGYAEDHNCDPICGPSLVYSPACRSSNPYNNYHNYEPWSEWMTSYQWRPNQCYGTQTAGWVWDGWNWKCGSTTYRCHDGWTYVGGAGSYPTKTICRRAV